MSLHQCTHCAWYVEQYGCCTLQELYDAQLPFAARDNLRRELTKARCPSYSLATVETLRGVTGLLFGLHRQIHCQAQCEPLRRYLALRKRA